MRREVSQDSDMTVENALPMDATHAPAQEAEEEELLIADGDFMVRRPQSTHVPVIAHTLARARRAQPAKRAAHMTL